jgi:hypothetical protein
MEIEKFEASVGNDDWVGSVAADYDVDAPNRLQDLLREQKRISQNDFVIGVRMWLGDNLSPGYRTPTVYALVVSVPAGTGAKQWLNEQDDPIPVRKIEVSLTVQQLLDFFLRFELLLFKNHLDLDERRYRFEPEE